MAWERSLEVIVSAADVEEGATPIGSLCSEEVILVISESITAGPSA